jgi:hypothetical protein
MILDDEPGLSNAFYYYYFTILEILVGFFYF